MVISTCRLANQQDESLISLPNHSPGADPARAAPDADFALGLGLGEEGGDDGDVFFERWLGHGVLLGADGDSAVRVFWLCLRGNAHIMFTVVGMMALRLRSGRSAAGG